MPEAICRFRHHAIADYQRTKEGAILGTLSSTIAGMTRREAILEIHRGAILDAARRHNATSIALVGSTARGDDTETSDCDFLADFGPGTTYFTLSDLAEELRALLGCEIDIIPSQGLKARKRHRILEDAITL